MVTLCACGCGDPVPENQVGRPRRYKDAAHRKRASRRRLAARGVTKRPSDSPSDPHVTKAEAPSALPIVEIANTRRVIRGARVNYTGPYPGFRVVDLLEVDGDRLRIRYRDPTAAEPLEEVLPVTKLTGVVEDGRIDRDPARMRAFLEAGE